MFSSIDVVAHCLVLDTGHSPAVVDLRIHNQNHVPLEWDDLLPARGGGGGGGGDFDLLELGITAFRNKSIRSSVRKTGPEST